MRKVEAHSPVLKILSLGPVFGPVQIRLNRYFPLHSPKTSGKYFRLLYDLFVPRVSCVDVAAPCYLGINIDTYLDIYHHLPPKIQKNTELKNINIPNQLKSIFFCIIA